MLGCRGELGSVVGRNVRHQRLPVACHKGLRGNPLLRRLKGAMSLVKGHHHRVESKQATQHGFQMLLLQRHGIVGINGMNGVLEVGVHVELVVVVVVVVGRRHGASATYCRSWCKENEGSSVIMRAQNKSGSRTSYTLPREEQ